MLAETNAQPKRRRRKRGQTKPAIINAAIKILLKEGPEPLSTTRLAKEVGIVQSGFYAHFQTVEECYRDIVQLIDDNLRSPFAKKLAELRETDASDLQRLTDFFDELITSVDTHWQLMALYLAFRGDKSTIGKMIQQVEQEFLYDMLMHLKEMKVAGNDLQVFAGASDKNLTAMATLLFNQVLTGLAQCKKGNLSKLQLAKMLAFQTGTLGEFARLSEISK